MTVYPLPRGQVCWFIPRHSHQAIAILSCMVLQWTGGCSGTEARPAGRCVGPCMGGPETFVKKTFRPTRQPESPAGNRLVLHGAPRRPDSHENTACDRRPNLRLSFGRLQGRSRRISSLLASSRECLMFRPHFPPMSFPQQPGLFVSQQGGDQ
jgi:hypothetical protein